MPKRRRRRRRSEKRQTRIESLPSPVARRARKCFAALDRKEDAQRKTKKKLLRSLPKRVVTKARDFEPTTPPSESAIRKRATSGNRAPFRAQVTGKSLRETKPPSNLRKISRGKHEVRRNHTSCRIFQSQEVRTGAIERKDVFEENTAKLRTVALELSVPVPNTPPVPPVVQPHRKLEEKLEDLDICLVLPHHARFASENVDENNTGDRKDENVHKCPASLSPSSADTDERSNDDEGERVNLKLTEFAEMLGLEEESKGSELSGRDVKGMSLAEYIYLDTISNNSKGALPPKHYSGNHMVWSPPSFPTSTSTPSPTSTAQQKDDAFADLLRTRRVA